MFTVDNTSDSDGDFKLIRSKVSSLIRCRNEFTIEYPIRYLLFCLELQNVKCSVLSLNECRIMAARYGIRKPRFSIFCSSFTSGSGLSDSLTKMESGILSLKSLNFSLPW